MNASVAEPEKRVSWAELFFDLVFVFAVTQVSALLEHDHAWSGLLRALVVFVPIYWMWVGAAIQTNLRDVSRPLMRLEVFGIALTAVFMAIALPHAYDTLGLLFALAYWIGRIILALPQLITRPRGAPMPITPPLISLVATGPLFVVGALVPAGPREAIWGLAAFIELAGPTALRGRLSGMHLDAAHLSERFGLFVLIALGESVVAIGVSAQAVDRFTVGVGGAVVAAFALSCGLWWVYFHFAADAMRHALATAEVQLHVTRLVLSYGHLAFISAIVLTAVGLHDVVSHPGEHLGWATAGMLVGGTALYLGTFGFTRWAMFRLVSTTRLTAAAAVLAFLPLAARLPGLVAVAILAVGVGLLNAVELWRVESIGWRARLDRRHADRARNVPNRDAHGPDTPTRTPT